MDALPRFLRKKLAGNVSDFRLYRLLEILPGLLVWTTIIGAVVLSAVNPVAALAIIIIFDLYWLFRVIYLLVFLVVSYRRYRAAIGVDWGERLRDMPNWQRLYHVIFLPTYKEPIEVSRSTLRTLAACDYPKDRMIVVFAIEERDYENAHAIAETLRQEFGPVFKRFLVTEHPDNIAGEIAGKGSNIAWAGHRFKELVDSELHIPYDDIVVSSFDIDTQPHRQYFSYLAYQFLTHPKPTRTSFQPVPLFNNNIWRAPAIMRVAANATTFWLMTEQVRPERLFTFASHSMSFRALVDVGFWQSDIVTEDSRIFLQCLLRYDGDYTVTPMYLPVSMDTVLGKNLWRSFVNLYKQQRRWAYGVENFPFMAWYFAQNKLIPFNMKFRYIWNQLEGVYSWATAPLLIFLLGRLPLLFGKDRLAPSILAANAPHIVQYLMVAAMVGLFVSAILSTSIVPPVPKGKSRMSFAFILLQWLLFPIVMIVFGSIPATDAQTRLMLGKYLGFWVTEKQR